MSNYPLTTLARLVTSFLRGAPKGADAGTSTNTRLLDLATGPALYHNHSHGDHAARILQERADRNPNPRS